MLKILNNSLDGIVLGQKKADFDDVILHFYKSKTFLKLQYEIEHSVNP